MGATVTVIVAWKMEKGNVTGGNGVTEPVLVRMGDENKGCAIIQNKIRNTNTIQV